jgi:hypothetical protein
LSATAQAKNVKAQQQETPGRPQISLSPRILIGLFLESPHMRAVGFLKSLIVPVTNLPWAAESHFAFTFKSGFFLLWAALVLRTAGLYNFLANGMALIAKVGSVDQAQPTRVLASVLHVTAFDRSQPTQKAAQAANRISPSKCDNEPSSRPPKAQLQQKTV